MRNPTQIKAQQAKLERELADWYQAHKNDPLTDAAAVEPRSIPTVFSIRLDPDLIARLRELAEFYGCTTSEVARRLLADAWLPAVQVGPVSVPAGEGTDGPDLAEVLQALVGPILERTKDHIGTHYDGCYEFHVGCLAAAVQRRIGRKRVDVSADDGCIDVHVCPECVAGKCRNCHGDAWCTAEDGPTACSCDRPGHVRTDSGS